MDACSKLSSSNVRWRKGKSRTCMKIAKTEKNNMKMSSKYLRLEKGLLNGYQNLAVKLVEPLRA